MSTAIVWFRRDLRLEDNPALSAAVAAHDRVICAYIHAPQEEKPWAPGAASRWWLHHSLQALHDALVKAGTRLHLRRGPSDVVLEAMIRAGDAVAVYWNRQYEPAAIERDKATKARLQGLGIEAHSFNSSLLAEPWNVTTGGGGPYRVFTPFWRNVRETLTPTPPQAAPRRIAGADIGNGVGLDELRLRPRIGWDGEFANFWTPGEKGARAALRRFLDKALRQYAVARDQPDSDGTSRLSPHLHFGEIGPRQVAWALAAAGADGPAAAGADAFMRELGWREFSHHLLFHFPESAERNLDARFDQLEWAAHDAHALDRWQRGMTGIPFVDAGMRQLWRSGWMHNRVRMIVASFLTKNLRQHWLAGARWFWDTLVDADLANNTQGWQWTAGSGADAAPYFRIFNPVAQGQRFDPHGAYVRRWVPELASVPDGVIHAPWTAPGVLAATGYPAPLVDLAASRKEALRAYHELPKRDAAARSRAAPPGDR